MHLAASLAFLCCFGAMNAPGEDDPVVSWASKDPLSYQSSGLHFKTWELPLAC